ncbi:hypothetical protein AGRA3207_005403 [Actinomadura graeca]|uniref:Uncharacterized protein n=1 Tax=Actinomadura graeca TaxID=2750812 RepID=A0ABX8QZ95_9ACTN|nr:hypothetical protein [Actinomadura graeca]QXJ24141.1 hypothetical protein AGRA3207_005403 [Actinomadura graeca]
MAGLRQSPVPRAGRGSAPGTGGQRLRSAAPVRPDRKPPSELVECWSEPPLVFGSTIGPGGVAAAVSRRAGALRAVVLRVVADLDAVARGLAAVVRDEVDVRAADVFGLAADDLDVDALALDVAVLRAGDDLAAPTRADAVDLDRPVAAVDDLRAVDVPDVVLLRAVDARVPEREPVLRAAVLREPVLREPVLREPVLREPVLREAVLREPVLREPVLREAVLREPVLRAAVDREPARAVVDFAVIVMTLAAESIALAASVIALVAVVIALVMAVMAFADVDALVATDFICVAAALAWLAALVTRVAAAEDVRPDAALVRLAVVLPEVPVLRAVVDERAVERLDAVLAVVRDADDLAADDVLLVAGFLAAVDLFADVLFVRLAVPRLDVVRDAVLVGTDLPPVMISYGEIYSTLGDALHSLRHFRVRSRQDARRSWSPGTPSCDPCRARPSSLRGWSAGRA